MDSATLHCKYTNDRVIRAEGVVSEYFKANRGITAGSGLATAEMRVVMLRIVEQASRLAPEVVPTLFVDELSAEISGGRKFVHQKLVSFTQAACLAIERDGMEVSRTKSICTASEVKHGKEIVDELKVFDIKFQQHVISLGAALGAGTRRNMSNSNARLRKFRKRVVRSRKLRRARIDTARLMRTGAVKALSYGQAVT